ncbi:hypothetical protein JAAARDRAFT_42279 [Jaapia argillacea MUCL 33604]|uniref:Yippee domain-containing protein n=1 Tax=Jaapia argillacea MUCL 33604 TaxID=933084 RepID=A0A067PGZ1_9AGAM|nr:hypothetical protein JAAARDRAFT_42279 [Jaapia argillacea MUCL 33604]
MSSSSRHTSQHTSSHHTHHAPHNPSQPSSHHQTRHATHHPSPHPNGSNSVDLTSRTHRRPIICRSCGNFITDMDYLLSTAFVGFNGKAALFQQTSNVTLSPPSTRLMCTGAHTIQEMTCAVCQKYIGWNIVRAHDITERWKEGKFLLELEAVTGHESDEEKDEKKKVEAGWGQAEQGGKGDPSRRRATTLIPPVIRKVASRLNINDRRGS